MTELGLPPEFSRYFTVLNPSEINVNKGDIFYRDKYNEIINYIKILDNILLNFNIIAHMILTNQKSEQIEQFCRQRLICDLIFFFLFLLPEVFHLFPYLFLFFS